MEGMERNKDYGEDYDYSMQMHRKLFSVQKNGRIRKKREDGKIDVRLEQMNHDNQAKEIQKLPEEPQNDPEEPQHQLRRKKKKRRPQQHLKHQNYLQNGPSEGKTHDQGKEKDSVVAQQIQNNVMEKIPDQQTPGPAQKEDRWRSEVKHHMDQSLSQAGGIELHPLKAPHSNSSEGNPNPVAFRDRDIPMENIQEVSELKKRLVTNPAMFDEVQNERHDLVNRMGNQKVFLGGHVDKASKNSLDVVEVKKKKNSTDERPSLDGDEVKAEAMMKSKHPKGKAEKAVHVLKDDPKKAVVDDNNENEIQDNAIHIEETEDGRDGDAWVDDGFSEEEDYDLFNKALFDVEVKWNQTFQAKPLDLNAMRSDWIDLKCNVSGNLLLYESEALSIVEAFMKKLNKKYPR